MPHAPETPDSATLRATLARLEPLLGRWKGGGSGQYPTIEPFDYDETTEFLWSDDHPLIRFEQKTWIHSTREPSHWEVGYIRPLRESVVEIASVQVGGRLEALEATVVTEGSALILEATSLALAHDPRVLRTRRRLRIEGDTLEYESWMSTTTTSPTDQMLNHLVARLARR